MKAKKLIFALFFIATFSAAAFGQWTTQETTADILRDIDGITTSGLTTICAVGNLGTVEITNDYGDTWTLKTSPKNIILQAVSIVGNNIYVGGYAASSPITGEVYLSTDWGNSWVNRSPPSPGNDIKFIHDLSFGTASNGILVGEGVASLDEKTNYTTDGGVTWNPPVSGTPETMCNAVHFFTSTNAIAVSNQIHRTTDGGANWTREDTGEAENLYGIHFPTSTVGYIVGYEDALRKTTDGGDNWTKSRITGSPNYTDYNWNAVYFVDALEGWVVGQHLNSEALIYHTTDGGSSWSQELFWNGANATPLYGVFFADADNGWAVGRKFGGGGNILARINTLEVTSVVQTARPTQHQAPQGFTGNVDISGTNFQAGAWVSGDVSFSGTGITVNSVTRDSYSKLTANISIDAAATTSTRDVTVTNIDGSSDTLVGGFTVTLRPIITNVVDDYINPTQTKTIAITGTGFQKSGGTQSAVSIYPSTGLTVGATTVSANSIQVTITAAGATTGARHLTITNPDGGTPSLDPLFSIVPVSGNPTITDVSPTTVYQNTVITMEVNGTSFESGATVTFSTDGLTAGGYNYAGIPAQFTFQLTANATAPTGSRGITVNNPSGGIGTKSNAFFVAAPGAQDPTIEALVPNEGYQGQTTLEVSITGDGFTDEAQGSLPYFSGTGEVQPQGFVAFSDGATGITIQDIRFISTRQLILCVDIAPDANPGPRAITILNPDGGNRTKANMFTVLSAVTDPRETDVVGPILAYPNPCNVLKNDTRIQFQIDGPANVEIRAYDITGRALLKSPKIVSYANGGIKKVTILKTDWNHAALGSNMILLPVAINNQKTRFAKLVHLGWR